MDRGPRQNLLTIPTDEQIGSNLRSKGVERIVVALGSGSWERRLMLQQTILGELTQEVLRCGCPHIICIPPAGSVIVEGSPDRGAPIVKSHDRPTTCVVNNCSLADEHGTNVVGDTHRYRSVLDSSARTCTG